MASGSPPGMRRSRWVRRRVLPQDLARETMKAAVDVGNGEWSSALRGDARGSRGSLEADGAVSFDL